ncbi:MAG: BatA and WFA domain-containing protein [Planctomycetota bacterium]
MGFLTPVLLGGAALIAVPILLHLVMRRQPRRLDFPALRFVQQRRRSNQRRMQLRHWLLLALRCALIAGLAFALARPTLKGTGLRGKEGAPLAVAVVVDNSLRMQLVSGNQTRLEQAREAAGRFISQLPEGSKVAVVDRSGASSGFAVDTATARSRADNLLLESAPRPLDEAVIEAIDLLAQQPDHRQELFLFSDLTTASLGPDALTAIAESLESHKEVRLYIADVGVDQPINAAITRVEVPKKRLRQGEPLRVEASVELTGLAETQVVELFVRSEAGDEVKRGQRFAEAAADGTALVKFEVADLPLGTHQGHVALSSSDPLAFDNRRSFTVEVTPPTRVLLLGQSTDDTLFLSEALSPSFLNNEAGAFRCTSKTFAQLTDEALQGQPLTEFDAVCLLDPPPLEDRLWQALVDAADEGLGVGIFLGHRARPSAFAESLPQQLLPGPLARRSRDSTHLRPRNLDHPATVGLKNYAEDIPWQVYPVLTHWQFEELAGDAFVVARYANRSPAIVERPVGRGRLITITTPVSDPLEPEGREPWNLLPTGPEPWPFVALSRQLVGYLAQRGEEQLNLRPGETATIRLPGGSELSSFVFQPPDGLPLRRTLPPGADSIQVGSTRALGNYRVVAGGRSGELDRGFSVNAAPELSRLERIDGKTLTAALPADRVRVAREFNDVQKYVDVGRTGRELFPWAISLVAMVWCAEGLLSNRFYRGGE